MSNTTSDHLQSEKTAPAAAPLSHSNSEQDTLYLDAPPPIFWHIKDGHRIRSAIIFTSIIFFEAGVLPQLLYFSLRWGAKLSEEKNLAIITSLIGLFSGFKLAHRSYLLLIGKGHESRRPIGAGRWGFDTFQAVILWGVTFFFVPLIIGSSIPPGVPQVVGMALPCFVLSICLPTLISGLFGLKIRVPFRVSSFPPGAHLPPLTYVLIEDLVAVDGGGGIDFRHAFKRRYEESTIIRKLMRDTAVWWGLSGTIVGAGLITITWTTDYYDTDVGYALSYSFPWVWALFGTLLTIRYAKKEVQRERAEWMIPSRKVHRTMTLDIEGTVEDIEGPPRRPSMHETRANSARAKALEKVGRKSLDPGHLDRRGDEFTEIKRPPPAAAKSW